VRFGVKAIIVHRTVSRDALDKIAAEKLQIDCSSDQRYSSLQTNGCRNFLQIFREQTAA
jgi:hypothetical protein